MELKTSFDFDQQELSELDEFGEPIVLSSPQKLDNQRARAEAQAAKLLQK